MDTVKKPRKEQYVKRHNDGSLWAKGTTVNGVPESYCEWFRKDGTKWRSGYFKDGKQTGKWITYDKNGNVYKVTNMRQVFACGGAAFVGIRSVGFSSAAMGYHPR